MKIEIRRILQAISQIMSSVIDGLMSRPLIAVAVWFATNIGLSLLAQTNVAQGQIFNLTLYRFWEMIGHISFVMGSLIAYTAVQSVIKSLQDGSEIRLRDLSAATFVVAMLITMGQQMADIGLRNANGGAYWILMGLIGLATIVAAFWAISPVATYPRLILRRAKEFVGK